MPSKPDPKHVVLSLYPAGIERAIGRWGASTGDPTVYQLPDIAFTALKHVPVRHFFGTVLEKHIRLHGDIDALVIGGHGSYGQMSGDGNRALPVESALQEIARLEKVFGRNPIKRIVFSGCNVFEGLHNETIRHYRDFAQQHGIEIVGSTSFTGATVFGRYVRFTPKGTVVRDMLDTPYNPMAAFGYDRRWVDLFLNRTQEEGEKARFTQAVAAVRTFIAKHAGTNRKAVSDPRESELYLLQKEDPSIHFSISEDWTHGVVLNTDGQVLPLGKTVLHQMSKEEMDHIRVDTFQGKPTAAYMDGSAVLYSAEVLLKDQKHILLATQDGAFAVVDVPPEYQPQSSVPKTAKPVKLQK